MDGLFADGSFSAMVGDIDDEDGHINILIEGAPGQNTPSALDVGDLVESVISEALANAVIDVPVGVSVRTARGIGAEPEVVRGGVQIHSCTTAFTASNNTYRGVLSAAHCLNTAPTRPAGSNVLAYRTYEHFGSHGDARFWRTTDSTPNSIVLGGTGRTQTITSRVDTRSNGIPVCNVGRTRGGIGCAEVRRWNHSFTYDGVRLSRMAQTTGTFTQGGDSGGPWYHGNGAYGVHFGKSGGYSTYSRIFDVEAVLGVRVNTS